MWKSEGGMGNVEWRSSAKELNIEHRTSNIEHRSVKDENTDIYCDRHA